MCARLCRKLVSGSPARIVVGRPRLARALTSMRWLVAGACQQWYHGAADGLVNQPVVPVISHRRFLGFFLDPRDR